MPAKRRLFAYGTLQIREVMNAVTGADFPAQPAWLINYARYCLAGHPYPGLRRKWRAVTEGVLFSDIDTDAFRRLDDFEDDFYRRKTLIVSTGAGLLTSAEVYVIPPQHYSLLLNRLWELEAFRKTLVHEFLARCQQRRRAQPSCHESSP